MAPEKSTVLDSAGAGQDQGSLKGWFWCSPLLFFGRLAFFGKKLRFDKEGGLITGNLSFAAGNRNSSK